MWQGPKIISDKIKAIRLIVSQKLQLLGETITAAGAVSVSTPVSYLYTGAAIAITLANGIEGQVKTIIMTNDGGTATLTPTSYANGTTIVFDDVYDMWQGIFHAGSWYNIGTPTATCS